MGSSLIGSAGELADQTKNANFPKPVAGRVAHIDADFMAYQVSAESKDELDPAHPKPRKSVEDMQHNATMIVEYIMGMAGATTYHLHTTPSGSTKGGRYDQAIQKEYQGGRVAVDKPAFLDLIRAWLISELGSGGRGTAHRDQEADDGLAQAAWGASDPNLVVICSRDKDLRIVPGWHLIDDKMVKAKDNFGHLELIQKKGKPAKLVGLGTKFFWAQCLMGDTVDNIQGLPMITGRNAMTYMPTKAHETLMSKWIGETSTAKLKTLGGKLEAIYVKQKQVGPAMAYNILLEQNNDRKCFQTVKQMFTDIAADGYEFKHWKTGEKVHPTKALLGDMKLLWMRRNTNPNDVWDWLKEVTK